jgi:hypothetical protein
MCDAQWRNKPKGVETLIANCLAHGTIAILRKLAPRRLQSVY